MLAASDIAGSASLAASADIARSYFQRIPKLGAAASRSHFDDATMRAPKMTVAALQKRMDQRFQWLDRKLDTRFKRMNRRLTSHDARFRAIDERFNAVDARFERMERLFGEVFRRLDSLNDKLDSNTRRLDTTLRLVDERLTRFQKAVDTHEDRLNEIESHRTSS